MKRVILILVAVVVVVALGVAIEAPSRRPLAVEPAGESIADEAAIYAPGRIEGATRETGVYPQAGGTVVEVAAVEGQWVESGELLYRLNDEEPAQVVRLAQAELVLAQNELVRMTNGARDFERAEAAALHQGKMAELEQAQLALRRIQSLGRGPVASQELDDQRTRVAALTAEVAAALARSELLHAPPREDELEIARARVSMAQARLAAAQVQLDRTQVRAPAAGKVLLVDVEPGEYVDPLTSKAPVIMADTRRMRIRAFVEELDAPRVEAGMSAQATADGLAESLQGCVVQVSPRMTAKELWSDRPHEHLDTKTREVWIDLEGTTDLVIGLRVDVLINPISSGPAPPESLEKKSPQLSASPESKKRRR